MNSDVSIYPDGSVIFNSGQMLKSTHRAGDCLGDVCTIHKPTEHSLRGEQLFYNGRHMVRRVKDELLIDPDDFFFLSTGKAILRNSATCSKCGDSITSAYRHNYVTCSCGEISVDGGVDYLRRAARSFGSIIETSITIGDV